MKLGSRALPLVGLAFAVVAAIGYVVFGWRFGDGNQLTFALGVVAVAIALGAQARDHLQ
jgi:cobalamin synthase